MKRGDLVRIEGWYITGQQFFRLGIFLRNIGAGDPKYSSAFPCCEVLEHNGVKRIGLERVFNA